MKIKFKIKNVRGETSWWSPGENIRYDEWSLGNDNKILFCDVVDDYRSLCRKEPILTELIRIPTSTLNVELIFQCWDERGDEWLKSFVFAYQEIGNHFYDAVDLANKIVWTGAEFNAENQDESYENVGEYFARKYGFVDCLNAPKKWRETLRLADFGRAQEKRLGTRLQASVTFGEWLLTGN